MGIVTVFRNRGEGCKVMKKLLLLTLILFLTGCAVSHVLSPDDDEYERQLSKSLVIVSISEYGELPASVSGPVSWNPNISYRSLETEQNFRFPAGGEIFAEDIPGGKVRVVALEMEPGIYEIFNWTVVRSSGYGNITHKAPRPFSYRFEVNAAESVYIGELALTFSKERGLLGDLKSVNVEMREAFKRDVAIARRTYFHVPFGDVEQRLAVAK